VPAAGCRWGSQGWRRTRGASRNDLSHRCDTEARSTDAFRRLPLRVRRRQRAGDARPRTGMAIALPRPVMTPLCRIAVAAIVPFAVLTATLVTGCRSSEVEAPSAPPVDTTVAIVRPTPDAPKPIDLPGLHNVVSYTPGVLTGGQPEGGEGLQTLAAMGVRTIITVDGAKPDVDAAQRLGMRYVHLPISYDTVTPQRQKELAQAVSSCEGPIYLHCHHGKHRSAAALSTALVLCGTLTPEQAKARMHVSGTAQDYTGLWAAVDASKPIAKDQLQVDPATLPSVATVTGMVATMAEIDQVIDLVKQAQQAGWSAPQDHPDLVATKETARLASLFADLAQDRESVAMPADYQAMLAKSIEQTKALDAAVRAADAPRAKELLTAINKSCKECHVVHRDK
jgi:protein tyrosine phosphatase (PTP) superfamily phosphohydrolase (DUF442 family)